MNKQREALKLALDALEEIHPGNMTPMAEQAWNKAINAIREALAEPEQEPVAWRIADERNWEYRTEPPLETDIQWSARYGRKYEPLYTTPPTRKPLTDERIDKIIASNVTITDQHLLAAVYMAIREVEQAHGISSD
jgi:Mg-chelatase subunit ChlD